jgi:hypothetical protein
MALGFGRSNRFVDTKLASFAIDQSQQTHWTGNVYGLAFDQTRQIDNALHRIAPGVQRRCNDHVLGDAVSQQFIDH